MTPTAPGGPELPEVDEAPDTWGPDHDDLTLTEDEIEGGNLDGETVEEPEPE